MCQRESPNKPMDKGTKKDLSHHDQGSKCDCDCEYRFLPQVRRLVSIVTTKENKVFGPGGNSEGGILGQIGEALELAQQIQNGKIPDVDSFFADGLELYYNRISFGRRPRQAPSNGHF